MQLIKFLLGFAFFTQGLLCADRVARAGEKIEAVATFSILADMVEQVGGNRVRVKSLVGPGSDAHVFQATPADAVMLKRAALVIENGLGFEGWLDRLVAASGYEGLRVVASKGISPLSLAGHDNHGHGHHGHSHGDGHGAGHHHDRNDPHAWQDVRNAVVYVENIARGLCAADPMGCADYERNAAGYVDELKALDEQIAASFSSLPEGQRKIITSHTAFDYFAKRYAIEIFAPEGVSTEQEAAALDVAALIRQIRKNDIKALFVENISDRRLIEQIGRETGLKPSGRLYSDALSKAGGDADSYLAMMQHNANTIAKALKSVAAN